MSDFLNISEAASIAMHSMAFIASKEGVVTVPDISSGLKVSENHLSKVMQRLTKNGLVKSVRGPRCGYMVARPIDEISLIEVYEAIEGAIDSGDCLFDRNKNCNGKCIMGDTLEKTRNIFKNHLTGTKLSDVVGLYR